MVPCMTEEKKSAKSLVSSLLGKSNASAAPVLPDDSPMALTPGTPEYEEAQSKLLAAAQAMASTTTDSTEAVVSAEAAVPETVELTQEQIDREVEELIEVYFSLEEPTERDVVFDRIVALHSPLVPDFLFAMMEEDEDEYVRASAAAELAKLHKPEAIAFLEADLAEPEDLFFFENALHALGDVRGPAFYDTAKSLWQDKERDADERRAAMLCMETVDTPRAMADFVLFVESQTDIRHLEDDLLELAMIAFVRQGHRAAHSSLKALRERIANATMDLDEQNELCELVQEGMDLLIDRS